MRVAFRWSFGLSSNLTMSQTYKLLWSKTIIYRYTVTQSQNTRSLIDWSWNGCRCSEQWTGSLPCRMQTVVRKSVLSKMVSRFLISKQKPMREWSCLASTSCGSDIPYWLCTELHLTCRVDLQSLDAVTRSLKARVSSLSLQKYSLYWVTL